MRVPQDDFNRMWDCILLYDEHTWGAYNSIGDPKSDFVTRQFAVKAAYSLWLTPPEKQAMLRILRSCPGQTLPLR